MALDVGGSIGAVPLGGDRSVYIDVQALLNRPAWQADAACIEHPEVDFFPQQGEPIEPALRVCEGCLVRQECRDYAIAHNEKGVWGGLSAIQRTRARRQSRAA